jgi:glycosyltransferase involved in cell wall biosynthesis
VAIERVVSDDRLRHDLIGAGRERVAEFSWRATAERMAALYDSLAMERTG